MAKTPIPAALRQFVLERAKFCCEYCQNQLRFSTAPFTGEHIIPQILGGTNDPDNLVGACMACNGHKFTKTHALDPISQKLAPLFNPRTQVWKEHFSWSEDFSKILGRTPTGRATVNALNFNRIESVNLRHALYQFGKHPPK